MKALLVGAGVCHNNYVGVDGSSNFRYTLIDKTKYRVEWDYLNVSYPYVNSPKYNPLIDTLGYYKLEYLFIRQAMCKPVQPKDVDMSEYDRLIIETRPKFYKPNYLFTHESYVLTYLMEAANEFGVKVSVVDFDDWLWHYEPILQDLKHVKTFTNILNHRYKVDGYIWPNFTQYSSLHIDVAKRSLYKVFDYIHIGNVYNRQKYLHFFNDLAKKYRLAMTGNWNRFMGSVNNITFLGPTPHWSTIPMLLESNASIVIGNDFQTKYSTLQFRIGEALMAKCPLYFMSEYQHEKAHDFFRNMPKELIINAPKDLDLTTRNLDHFVLFSKHYSKYADLRSIEKIVQW